MATMTPIYKHGDAAYVILRKKPISYFAAKLGEMPNMDYVKIYMEWVQADHVLRSDTHFMFCETVQDAQIIEDEHVIDNAN
jgi:hypothetical protein